MQIAKCISPWTYRSPSQGYASKATLFFDPGLVGALGSSGKAKLWCNETPRRATPICESTSSELWTGVPRSMTS